VKNSLEELLRLHKKAHEEWLRTQSNKAYMLHESIVKAMEAFGWRHKTPLIFEAKDTEGRIIFHGTRGLVEETNKYHKHHTCIEYQANWKPFIIDMGESWLEEKLDALPGGDYPIIITHAHPDHLFGLRNLNLKGRTVYISGASLASEYWIEEKDKGYEGLDPQVFHRQGVFALEGRRCVAVPILHSIKAPNQALFFEFCGKKICHATDVLSIRKADRDKYLKNIDIYIGDGSSLRKTLIHFRKKEAKMGKPYGHASVKRQLQWARDANVKCCIFTHWGSEAINMGEKALEEEVQKIAKAVGYTGQVYVAKDNSVLELPSMKWIAYTESLSSYISKKCRESLRFLEERVLEEFDSQTIEELESLAEIKDLKAYDPRDVRDDAVLGDDWRILLAWWSNYYAPNAPKKDQQFKWPKELILQKAIAIAKEMIRRGFTFDLPKNYKPGARDLFVKVIKAIGLKNFKWKVKEICYLPEIEGDLPGLYLVEPHAKWLWEGKKTLIVKTRPYRKYAGKKLMLIGEKAYGIGVLSEPKGPYDAEEVKDDMRDKHRISEEEWNKWWPDAKTVYLFTWKWIEKYDPPKDYVRVKGTQTFVKRVKLIESISEAEADALIKQYVDSSKWSKMKVEDREKLMKKRQFLEVLYPFIPTKTAKRGYRELEVFDKRSVARLAQEWFDEHPGASIYVEVKFDGMRVVGHKKGDKVRIYSEGGEFLEDNLPNLVADLKKLHCDSCILDAELVPYDEEGNALGRRWVIKALGKGKVDDNRWIAHVFDILWLNGKDLHKLPYEERRKILRGLELPRSDEPPKGPVKFHWVENIPRIAHNVEEVLKYTKEVSAIPFSEGAMYKLSDSDYPITKRTPLWAKWKKFFDIDAMVLHRFPKLYRKGPKKGQPIPGQWVYLGVIGPVTPPEGAKVYDLKDLWKEYTSMDHYKEVKSHKIQYIRYKGKVYSSLGISMSTNEDVPLGSVNRFTVRLIRKINDTEYHWLIPRFLEPRPEKTQPDPTSVADNIAKASQYKIEKAAKECLVEEYIDIELLSDWLETYRVEESEEVIEEVLEWLE